MIINNEKDPIKQSGPPAGQVLMERFGQVANGFPLPVIVDAAMNLLINAVRQSAPKRVGALCMMDELHGKAKTILDMHYDSVTGNRRNIFAHTQHIIMDTLKDPEGL